YHLSNQVRVFFRLAADQEKRGGGAFAAQERQELWRGVPGGGGVQRPAKGPGPSGGPGHQKPARGGGPKAPPRQVPHGRVNSLVHARVPHVKAPSVCSNAVASSRAESSWDRPAPIAGFRQACGPERASSIAAASSGASSGFTNRPLPKCATSATPPTSLATNGVPQAVASSKTLGTPSDRLGPPRTAA